MVGEHSLRWAYAFVPVAIMSTASAAPPGFPESGNGLWYNSPGTIWSREWLPIGNGYLAGERWYLPQSC